ncbi:MAG TPA: 50S ribosomal protein L13 [Oligoflexia bacterium]|nr:50S ribosomal protein L13 [Oligoflexia bacterium]HMR24869.1 50S ribosomal protein L13 [Oligoflexia bacterium]
MIAKTYSQKKEQVTRHWKVMDADGKILGRLATEVARVLKGKHKPTFTPHVDGGDFVVVTNAAKIKLTGNKLDQKVYYHHTGYRGGLKQVVASELLENNPCRMIEYAVKGMLPKGSLGRDMIKKLKIYAGEEHPHEAQQPQKYEF